MDLEVLSGRWLQEIKGKEEGNTNRGNTSRCCVKIRKEAVRMVVGEDLYLEHKACFQCLSLIRHIDGFNENETLIS
jgi:hypothetical protein